MFVDVKSIGSALSLWSPWNHDPANY